MDRPRELSMETPENGTGRMHNDASAGRRTPRSATNRSSSSSEILVAPGPPTTSKPPSVHASPARLSPALMMARPSVGVVRRDGIIVLTAKNDAAREFFQRLKEDDERKAVERRLATGETAKIKDEVNEDDGDGPNHRGTYSKKYVLQHPEINWVHRGQGRYLPAAHSRKSASMHRDSQPPVSDSSLRKAIEDWNGTIKTPTIPLRRRSLDDDKNGGSFATPKPRLSLRRQVSEAQTVSAAEHRSARFSRRSNKAVPTTEFERRSSRASALHNYNEDEDDEDDDTMGDKEPTYDKEYVEAHAGEEFYHTGNGWYKRGKRPQGRKMAKERDFEGHAVKRRRDGSWEFDSARTIHVSQLQNYPGVEFHHCGNGWYKPGPDATGHRTSTVVNEEGFENDWEVEDADEGEDEDAIVSKEYMQSRPDVEWVHRGKGRYKRKSAVSRSATQPSASQSMSVSPDFERDQTIYSKEYVIAHPEEQFHHRGNARYMRGPPPDHWASSRRKRILASKVAAQEDDNSPLYSKAYVKQHPNEEFHHRGQGRYARGPRPKMMVVEDDDDMLSDTDLDSLVDKAYVDAHPHETFHHRGQGRWARGPPPFGASNKVAVRGPGARDRSGATEAPEEKDGERPPDVTALVVKADGPERWPYLEWHYRGGGKWGRLTKQEYEDFLRGGPRKQKGKGRLRNANGPEAQLEREAAAAAGSYRGSFGAPGEMDVNGVSSQERPKFKRRRTTKHGDQEDGILSKPSSKSQSQAPTPKPRMLEPEEDILTNEDLPQLYQDDWSPDPEDIEEYGSYMPTNLFRPITSPEKFVNALTKHDPAVRSLDNLKRLAGNTQNTLDQLQQEYLYLERITAPHARIPRKPAKGGRAPIEDQIFEDKKEAELYDYTYDPRKIGYQDPQAQKIQRDAEGRELRNRRNRSGATTNNGTLPGWNFGEDEPLGPRRAVKPVNRFDGIVDAPRKRGRYSANASKAPSMTPDRTTTPLGGPIAYAPATSGRWRGHVPKRIREIQNEIAGSAIAKQRDGSPGAARKGRPPGSKNLHKRRDAGIKKGPRKPKAVDSIETPMGSEGEFEEGEEL